MNKALVISAVALTALVGKSDVVANNVVGYMNKDTYSSLYTMVTPAFQNVGKTTYSLYDLKGGGYEASKPNTAARPRWTGGCTIGTFEIEVLTNAGIPDTTYLGGGKYFWADAKTGFVDATVPWGPGWYVEGDTAGQYVALTDEEAKSITFELGQAFWVSAGAKTLVSSGEVSKNDLEVETNVQLYTAIGNGIPVDMTLADLTGGGYEASKPNTAARPRWTGGCTIGTFEVEILNNSGTPDTTLLGGGKYFWADAKTGFVDATVPWGPGWYIEGETAGQYVALTKEQAQQIPIPAGQGLWVSAGGKTLIFPSPLADHEAK